MFGIGLPELILIMALALIVVGPDKLPDMARSIAKTLVDLKKTADGLKDSFSEDDNPLSEIKPQLEDAAKNFKDTILDAETGTWKDPGDMADLKSIAEDVEKSSRENQADNSVYPPPTDAQEINKSDTPDTPVSTTEKSSQSTQITSPPHIDKINKLNKDA